jgi:2-hydroxychromene-2-carboxylate isomerase
MQSGSNRFVINFGDPPGPTAACDGIDCSPDVVDAGSQPLQASTIQTLLQSCIATDSGEFPSGSDGAAGRDGLATAVSGNGTRLASPDKTDAKMLGGASMAATSLHRRDKGLPPRDGMAELIGAGNVFASGRACAAATTDRPVRVRPAAKSIVFYFDFASPYGYLASLRVDAVAARHGVTVDWRPLPLGALFGWAERAPSPNADLKNAYLRHDCERTARRYGAPFRLPEGLPFETFAACRAFYHVRCNDVAGATRLAGALFHAAFGSGRDISGAQTTINAIAGGAGLTAEYLATELRSAAGDRQLERELQAAIRLGVFGSPFFVVDGEGFWGNDRLEEVIAWLARGGW